MKEFFFINLTLILAESGSEDILLVVSDCIYDSSMGFFIGRHGVLT